MTRSSATAVIVLALVGAGCAAPRGGSTAYRPSPSRSGVTIEQDAAYIARVERLARIRGVGVTWVHLPVKRTPATAPR